MKYLIASLIALTTLPALAQDTDKKYFMARQECEPVEIMVSNLKHKWKETPLFTGESLQFDASGTPFRGGSMFFVNQDVGSWSLVTLYGDGTACMIAVGVNFQPY